MKTFFRIILALVVFLSIGFGILYIVFNKPLPEGEEGKAAEALTEKMLQAVNKTAWDSTNVIKWTFMGGHNYVWDKQNDFVEVTWDDKRVLLNLAEWEKSKAYENGNEHIADKRGELLGTAYTYFCNDSFWLVAPFKVNDEGVKRVMVITENGTKTLLVSYTSGGVTPGDSYQWFLNEDGLPTHYRMWVSIIPIGGVEATWEGWENKLTGIMLPNLHKFGPVALDMGVPEAGYSLTDIAVDENLFLDIR